MFLIKKNINQGNYIFSRNYCFPFSQELDNDLAYLIGIGVIKESHTFWMNYRVLSLDLKNFTGLEYLNENSLEIVNHNLKMVKKNGIGQFYKEIYKNYEIEK